MEIECAHCGNKQLMQVPGVWSPIAMNDQGPVTGPSVPVVMLGCPKCGFLMMFSPQAVQPQPFPEQQAGQEETK